MSECNAAKTPLQERPSDFPATSRTSACASSTCSRRPWRWDVEFCTRVVAVDVVLGVAVTGPVARVALVGSTPGGPDVIDQSTVDVAENPIEKLTDTVGGTPRLLADENHRLVATGVCWSDQELAAELRRLLIDAGIEDVALLSESEAATALVRNTSRGAGEHGTAVLLVDDQTATLSMVDAG